VAEIVAAAATNVRRGGNKGESFRHIEKLFRKNSSNLRGGGRIPSNWGGVKGRSHLKKSKFSLAGNDPSTAFAEGRSVELPGQRIPDPENEGEWGLIERGEGNRQSLPRTNVPKKI